MPAHLQSSVQDADTRGPRAGWLARLVRLADSRSSKSLCVSNKTWEAIKEDT